MVHGSLRRLYACLHASIRPIAANDGVKLAVMIQFHPSSCFARAPTSYTVLLAFANELRISVQSQSFICDNHLLLEGKCLICDVVSNLGLNVDLLQHTPSIAQPCIASVCHSRGASALRHEAVVTFAAHRLLEFRVLEVCN